MRLLLVSITIYVCVHVYVGSILLYFVLYCNFIDRLTFILFLLLRPGIFIVLCCYEAHVTLAGLYRRSLALMWNLWSMSCCYYFCFELWLTSDRWTSYWTLWWWHTVKKLVQETGTSRLVQETWPSDMVSCARFFLYKFLAPNTAQFYSIQETCMHVTRMVNLLYKVNIVYLLIYFLNLFKLFK